MSRSVQRHDVSECTRACAAYDTCLKQISHASSEGLTVLYVKIQVLWEVTTLLQGKPLLLKITKHSFDSLGNAHTATKRHITEEGHAEITVTLDM